MKHVPTNTIAHVGNIGAGKRMGISAGAEAFLMSTLSGLYSNSGLAVIREYSTNALDSHIEAGNSDPILISLPTPENPKFVVQDFGVGLSLHEIEEIYSQYGASTKRDSDDVVGMWGLGCKSGLAFSTQFILDAVKDDMRSVCIVTRDSDGIGLIKTLQHTPTDAPNGVTITFDVPDNKIHTFNSDAADFFSYWEPGTVLVDGVPPRNAMEGYERVSEDTWIKGNQGYHRTHIVIMGNVPYKVNNQISIKVDSITRIPIGCVDITPAREDLHYTERTNATLKELATYLGDAFNHVLSKKFNSLSTEFDRWKFVRQWSWYLPNVSPYRAYANSIYFKDEVYGYSGSIYNETAYRNDSLDPGSISESLVIKNFDKKTIAEGHKERIKVYLKSIDSRLTRWCVVPAGTPLNLLSGYDAIVDWADITSIELPRKKREKVERTYKVFSSKDHTYKWVGDKIEGTVVYYHPRERRDVIKNVFASGISYVDLPKGELKSFLKLNPHAEHYSDYKKRRVQEVIDAVTDAQHLCLAIKKHGSIEYVLQNLKEYRKEMSKLSDPDLLACIDACDQRPLLPYWASFNVDAKKEAIVSGVVERYPLLTALTSMSDIEDVILYMNAKYELENKNS